MARTCSGVSIGSVVNNNHSTGTSSAGGSISRTNTTLTTTGDNLRSGREGGCNVAVMARTSTTALRLWRGCARDRWSHLTLGSWPRTVISLVNTTDAVST